jgi:hypothetical protein
MNHGDGISISEGDQTPAIVVVRFEVRPKAVKGAPHLQREATYVTWARIGAKGSTVEEDVERLKKDKILWPAVEPAYKAWLANQEEPTDGTPLSIFPGLNRWQAEKLRNLGIRTLEAIRDHMGEEAIQAFGMGGRALKQTVTAYLANRPQVETAGKLTALETENATLKAEMEELRQTVAKLAEKRKPGRPAEAAA